MSLYIVRDNTSSHPEDDSYVIRADTSEEAEQFIKYKVLHEHGRIGKSRFTTRLIPWFGPVEVVY